MALPKVTKSDEQSNFRGIGSGMGPWCNVYIEFAEAPFFMFIQNQEEICSRIVAVWVASIEISDLKTEPP